MPTAVDVLRVAQAELGYVEQGGHDGRSGNITKYWAELAPGFQGQPWCAAFAQWVYLHAGVAPVSRSFYVPRVVDDYKASGRLFPIDEAQPGDQILYSFGAGHTGIVEAIDTRARTVTAIEGNTSAPTSSGSQSDGGGVYRRVRPWVSIYGVGRPAFTTAPTSPPPTVVPFPGDHMHRIDLTVTNLDDKGNGWVPVPNTDATKIVSVVAQGAYPPADGYWNLPVFGRQQRGADTIIQISEADPRAAEHLSVWVAD